jgi:hypothetical protein
MQQIFIHSNNIQAIAAAETVNDMPIGVRPLAQEDVIIHRDLDAATVYNALLNKYDAVALVPVSAGTQLYAITGPNSSFVKTLTPKTEPEG